MVRIDGGKKNCQCGGVLHSVQKSFHRNEVKIPSCGKPKPVGGEASRVFARGRELSDSDLCICKVLDLLENMLSR